MTALKVAAGITLLMLVAGVSLGWAGLCRVWHAIRTAAVVAFLVGAFLVAGLLALAAEAVNRVSGRRIFQ